MSKKTQPELPKTYEQQGTEEAIYKHWEKGKYFQPNKKEGKSFVISLPPPNATGTLHIGHAMMLAVEDLMIRYHRLKGEPTLWVPGTDHAAIATQNVVEKKIWKEEKKDRHEIGREELVKRIEEFVKKSQNTIRNQFRRMGASLDWSRERYTLDEGLSRCVRMVFKMMYDDGLIYRGDRIVNWCTRCQTTLADDEVEHEEAKAKLYTFKYDANFPFAISTTRPETKLGDTAVAVNPDDNRYKQFVGQSFKANLAGTELNLKIVASAEVDMNFGTGALGVTPAHSLIDSEIAKTNNLPSINVIGENGKMTAAAGSNFVGVSVNETRKQLVSWLKDNNLLQAEENISQNLSVCYRCHTPVEPLISKQWFVNVNQPCERLGGKTIRQRSIEVVKNGDIKIIPERFAKTYYHWMNNLHDWCISRQIWFGHRIPVWYRDKAKIQKLKVENTSQNSPPEANAPMAQKVSTQHEEEIYVGIEAPEGESPSSDEASKGKWTQDPDTLDTWFSSGLWTFSTLLKQDSKAPDMKTWRAESPDLKRFHPTSVMETGYDIIFFWVARMILMTTYAMDEIPFRTVYLHGLVRDEQGRKMSKSLGNVIDPVDMIEKYGADPVRLSLIIGITPGNDSRLYDGKVAGYRNFVNKLWNISRYIIMTTKATKDIPTPKSLADSWILAEFNDLKKGVTEHIDNYRFSAAGEMLYEFTWAKLADWYVEVAKIEGNKDAILRSILRELLILWHPFTPFVTEHIWTHLNEDNMLIGGHWPSYNKATDKNAKEQFKIIQDVIGAVRDIKQELGTNRLVTIDILTINNDKKNLIKEQQSVIEKLGRCTINLTPEQPTDGVVKRVLTGITLHTTASVSEDTKAKLQKDREELKKYIHGLKTRLSNDEFKNRAPAEIIAKEKKRLQEVEEKFNQLSA